ncbi:hypothetical protein BKA81DRAFT_379123 [Phyllosticta paracitricarpa]|uniref:Uncharacterized protein n=1 Tax=Phyllosticta paracitricarpa TaxID=2016321 RepID=A0ABR1MZS8_9PEZI
MNLSRHPSDPWFNMSTHQHKLVLSPQILKMVDPDFERLRRVQERQLPSFNSISTQDETTNVNAGQAWSRRSRPPFGERGLEISQLATSSRKHFRTCACQSARSFITYSPSLFLSIFLSLIPSLILLLLLSAAFSFGDRPTSLRDRQFVEINWPSIARTVSQTHRQGDVARHGDSCLAKELRAGGLSERGFFGHPVLILSEPNEEGIVKIFPMTSFDGKTVEQKWSGIACPQRKEAMIGRYLQIAHPGIKSSIPEVRLANGQHLQKRTYLYTEVCWKVEASMLARFGHGDGLFLEEASLKTVLKTAARK